MSKNELRERAKYWKQRAIKYQEDYELEANKVRVTSIILNRIRQVLLSEFQWDGIIKANEKDLADVISRLRRTRSEACANVESPK